VRLKDESKCKALPSQNTDDISFDDLINFGEKYAFYVKTVGLDETHVEVSKERNVTIKLDRLKIEAGEFQGSNKFYLLI
jgi:hypothetical protein